MKLSDRTVTILKNFSLINQSLLFKKGSVLTTISTGRSILAKAKIAEKFPQDFAIYDLSRFLGVLSLFEEPDIKFEKDWLVIEANNHSVKYIYASQEMIDSPSKDVSIDNFEIKFTLIERNLSALMKAAAMMQLPEVAVVGDSKKMFIASLSTDNPTGDEYVVDITQNVIKNKFRMVFEVSNLKLLSDEYNVQISSKGIGCFTSKDLTYWVPCKQKVSSFEV